MRSSPETGHLTVVLGTQRGDEGKGREVDLLAPDHHIVARANGGPNSGHTISVGGQGLKLNQVPSGIRYSDKQNVIGNGGYLDPVRIDEEIKLIRSFGLEVTPRNLVISDIVHLIFPHHVKLDTLREEGDNGQGSTKRGIAYAAGEKYQRENARTEQILSSPHYLYESAKAKLEALGVDEMEADQQAEEFAVKALKLTPFIGDTKTLLQEALDTGKDVLAEGAQAYGLDIEHGMYPHVTSSHTTIGGILNGLGVGPQYLDRIWGVAKAVKSHVGGGPFVTEVPSEQAESVRGKEGMIDSEFGASTGRPRRIGYLDLVELRSAIKVNGITDLALNKLDCLPKYGQTMLMATGYRYKGQVLNVAPSSSAKLEACEPIYEEVTLWKRSISGVRKDSNLPKLARNLITRIEEEVGIPISIIGVGPHPDQFIRR